MRRHPRRVHSDIRELPAQRVRARLSAYIYGNILVLAAVGTSTPHTVENGHAVVVVLATTMTTYLAHVFAHAVGDAVLAEEEPETRSEELRDALPIISSGSLPALILLGGAVTDLNVGLAELLATAVIVIRLGGTGTLVTQLSGRPATRRVAWFGVGVAVVGIVIAGLKAWLLH